MISNRIVGAGAITVAQAPFGGLNGTLMGIAGVEVRLNPKVLAVHDYFDFLIKSPPMIGCINLLVLLRRQNSL